MIIMRCFKTETLLSARNKSIKFANERTQESLFLSIASATMPEFSDFVTFCQYFES